MKAAGGKRVRGVRGVGGGIPRKENLEGRIPSGNCKKPKEQGEWS